MAALMTSGWRGIGPNSRSSAGRAKAAPPHAPYDDLRSALRHFDRALKAADPALRPAPSFALSKAVGDVVEAVKDAPRAEYLGPREAKAVRRVFAKARGRLAQAVAAAQRSGDLAAAGHALEAAAVFGEAVTGLEFIEVVEHSWPFTGRPRRQVVPILWRGRVLDSAALDELAAATLQMEIPPLLTALREGPQSPDLLALVNQPYFLADTGFDLLARAQGSDQGAGKRALLLQRGRMARVAALLAEVTSDNTAGRHDLAVPPASFRALVALGTELCTANSNLLPRQAAVLNDLLRRVQGAQTSR